jgi:endonuclease/exonuclease/phosphatase (EEP) superfamily protein YafD
MQIAWLVAAFGVIALSVLGFLPIRHGIARMAEVPRQQFLGSAIALIAVAPFVVESPMGMVLAAGCVAAALVHAGLISRFTPLWPVQAAEAGDDPGPEIYVVVLNVKMSNRAYDATIALLQRESPDVIALIEVDDRWVDAMDGALAEWSHRVLHPLDTGYGMALFSRIPLEDVSVEELVLERVPSIWATLCVGEQPVRLIVAHPEPPVPYHDAVGRDAEVGLIAQRVAEQPLPAIVTGDLNDVGWSRTTRRFQRLSGLVDPRVGRGLYNSFHTRTRLARWPLEHLFHDPGFAVVALCRLEDVGSDHFPMGFRLRWLRTTDAREPSAPHDRDEEVVDELVEVERTRERPPVGEDWEASEE